MNNRWSLVARAAKAAATWASDKIAALDRDKGELRLRGGAFTTAAKAAMTRAGGIEDAEVKVATDGIHVHARKGNVVADVTLVPRYVEVEDGCLRMGFEADALKVEGASWLMGLFIALARVLLGDRAIVRRTIGAADGENDALVWEAPLESVPWVRMLLGALGPRQGCTRLPLRIDRGDIVVSWRDATVQPMRMS